jgi:hypothetical protein
MSERMTTQLRVIKAVVNALGAADISAWLFGGWGLDARIGRITRDHGDVEFWVERTDAGRSREVLVEAGATALAAQPPEESCEFTWGGVDFSTAYFDRRSDGAFFQYPHLRNGGPWRQKDIDDIKVLRGLAAETEARP